MPVTHPRRALAAAVALLAAALVLAGAPRTDGAAGARHHAAPAETAKARALHDGMRKLWEDHITWTRLAIVSFAADLPDLQPTEQRLLRNQKDLGDAIKPYYGRRAGHRLTALLTEHITGAVGLLAAAKSGDGAAIDAARTAWYANGDEIADFLHAANPRFWPKREMRAMMRKHLDDTLDEAVARLQGRFDDDIRAYERIHHHILEMADMLSDGIVRQFPRRFFERILDGVIARFTRWYDDHPVGGDTALAAVLLVVFVLPGDLSAPTDPVVDLAFSVALLACLPFRRRAPLAMFVVVGAICLLQIALLDHLVTGDVVALQAVYTVVAYGPGWAGAPAAVCAAAGALIGSIRWAGEGVGFAQTAATAVASVLLAAALGAWRRERAAALARDRDRQAEAGAARERARIARELHDVVAHSLSVIVVQADGAAAAAEQRPEAAAGALRTIADTGRDALAQMRRLLGVLRSDDRGALAPQPGIPQLEALVEQVSRAGLPAHLSVEGPARPVEGTVDVTAYRVAQEALTNVIKHAGEVTRVDVVLRYRDDALELLVRDDGRGGDADGQGFGLTGMAERVGLHGGELAASPCAGGGFAVRAVIPA